MPTISQLIWLQHTYILLFVTHGDNSCFGVFDSLTVLLLPYLSCSFSSRFTFTLSYLIWCWHPVLCPAFFRYHFWSSISPNPEASKQAHLTMYLCEPPFIWAVQAVSKTVAHGSSRTHSVSRNYIHSKQRTVQNADD